MSGKSKPLGTVILRQTYTKLGHNYLAVTVPQAIAGGMGWRPGEEIAMYPVKQRNGVRGVLMVSQQQFVESTVERYDDKAVQRVEGYWKELRGARPGSIAEREQKVASENDEILDRYEAKRRKAQGREEE